jgi:UPF0716 family protein affecting phage T7 exclusion
VRRVLLALLVLLSLDLALLVWAGGHLGHAAALAYALLGALAGVWLGRDQGMSLLLRWRAALEEGRVPEEGAVSGLLVLAGGALLAWPGPVTDAVGLALLLAPARRAIARVLRRRLERWFAAAAREGRAHVHVGVVEATPMGVRRREVVDGVASAVFVARVPAASGVARDDRVARARPAPVPGVIDVEGETVAERCLGAGAGRVRGPT